MRLPGQLPNTRLAQRRARPSNSSLEQLVDAGPRAGGLDRQARICSGQVPHSGVAWWLKSSSISQYRWMYIAANSWRCPLRIRAPSTTRAIKPTISEPTVAQSAHCDNSSKPFASYRQFSQPVHLCHKVRRSCAKIEGKLYDALVGVPHFPL